MSYWHKVVGIILLATAVITGAISTANACTILLYGVNWVGGTGNWSDPSNWDSGEPTSCNFGAYIDNGGTAIITETGEVGDPLVLGFKPGTNGNVEMLSGSLSGGLHIGDKGSGNFTQSGGTNSQRGLTLGGAPGGVGNYNLSGGTLSVTHSEYVGFNGYGYFTQSGGTHATNYLSAGHNTGSNGVYNQNGGSLIAIGEDIGYYGSGSFTQSGGTNSVANTLNIGYAAAASGSYNLSGTGSLSAKDAYIGASGTGIFIQNGGSNTVTNNLVLAGALGSRGSYELNGGSLSAGNEVVGAAGNAVFIQNGGTHTVSSELALGTHVGGSGTYNLNSGTLDAGIINIDLATFNLNGGSLSAGSINNRYGTFNYLSGNLDGDITNDSLFNLSGSGTRVVNGSVVNNVPSYPVTDPQFQVTNTTVRFTKTFINNSAYISTASKNYFTDLSVGDTGYLTGGMDDSFYISGDFINYSTQNTVWNTVDAYLGFTGAGMHYLYLTGDDLGQDPAGYVDNFAWGSFWMDSGVELFLMDGNGTPGGALYTEIFLLEDGLGQIDSIFGNGFNIYYMPTLPENAYLGGGTYALKGGGYLLPAVPVAITPVPEPATLVLLGSGIVVLACCRKNRLVRSLVSHHGRR